MLKVRFTQNLAISDVMNSGLETVIFNSKEVLAILDIRSVGYYKTKQGILQKNLSKNYRFESTDMLCIQFNRFTNTLKREENEMTQDKYPWLDPIDERKYMSDRELLDKYADLDKSCLTDEEKKQLMNMLYKYKHTFSLRDQIGTCPNIEVEIDGNR